MHLRSKQSSTGANHGQKRSRDHRELVACIGNTAVQISSCSHLYIINTRHNVLYFPFYRDTERRGHRCYSVNVDAVATSKACCDLDLWPPKSYQVISKGYWILYANFTEIAL